MSTIKIYILICFSLLLLSGVGFAYAYNNNAHQVNNVSSQKQMILADNSQIPTNNISPGKNDFDKLIESGSWLVIIPAFWFFGLLLGLTPCAVPIILIITSIYSSRKALIPIKHTLVLSSVYVVSLALLYAVIGVCVAAFGWYYQAFMQNSLVRILFSALFIILGLSLLGLFHLELHHRSLNIIGKIKRLQPYGAYAQTAFLGLAASIIAAPCIAAPLVGVLTYIANTGNIVLGGVALFFVGVGFGTPLFAFYIFGSEILQQAGNWQNHIKQFFGILLIGIAIWLLGRIIPAKDLMFLWSALAIFTAVYMGVFVKNDKIESSEGDAGETVCSLDGEEIASKKVPLKNIRAMSKMLSLMILLYGIILLIGALVGNDNPLLPLEKNTMLHDTDRTEVSLLHINHHHQLL